jgi:hypothetical protein
MSSVAGSVSGHTGTPMRMVQPGDLEKAFNTGTDESPGKTWRWKSGREKESEFGDIPTLHKEQRPVRLYAPIYDGLAAGLAVLFIGNGVSLYLFSPLVIR